MRYFSLALKLISIHTIAFNSIQLSRTCFGTMPRTGNASKIKRSVASSHEKPIFGTCKHTRLEATFTGSSKSAANGQSCCSIHARIQDQVDYLSFTHEISSRQVHVERCTGKCKRSSGTSAPTWACLSFFSQQRENCTGNGTVAHKSLLWRSVNLARGFVGLTDFCRRMSTEPLAVSLN